MSEVPVILQDLPTRIRGFCCLGTDYEPIIVLNSRLPVETQRRTYLHELRHIESGQMDDESYNEYGDAT